MKPSFHKNINRLRDRLIVELDVALRSVGGGSASTRSSPAAGHPLPQLSQRQRKHAAQLMRVNHSGEVCAQALYRGQAFSTHNMAIRQQLDEACREEADHLAWCAQRLRQLHSHSSRLNPLWYGMSWGIGAVSGVFGDRWNLGFLAATEKQVGEHLREHLQRLPAEDTASRSILQKMLEEETRHADNALNAGGFHFPKALQKLMRSTSRLMTFSSRFI